MREQRDVGLTAEDMGVSLSSPETLAETHNRGRVRLSA
jgi:hypothetical protein